MKKSRNEEKEERRVKDCLKIIVFKFINNLYTYLRVKEKFGDSLY